jgi:TP901 family phage tail tape measure protein
MAENNLTTYITANADFSSLRTQLSAVTAQLIKLQETTVGTNAKLGNQIAVMNKAFSETLRSTGQFSTHFVTLSSDVQKFGKNLDAGQLKLNQYFKVWQGHTRNTGNLIKDLAKQQVMLEQAIVQPLGKNAQGMMQYNVQVAKGLDLIKNKTALARQEAAILNKVMLDGSNQLINWGKNTQWAGRQLTVGLTVPLAAFGAAAQKAFLDANTEMVRLTKVYGGLAATSSTELAKVQKDVSATAKQMASAYGVAYKDTIALAADMAATGKQGNDLIASTAQTTRLSVLGEIDRQSAMKATLAIQNTFKQNTDQLAQSIDFLNAVENQTSTSLQDLTEAIPKAGPVIQAMGGSVKDLALYLTAMKEGGIDASSGANALKSALASLVNPTKVATDMFAGFGIDLKGIVNKNAGDLTGTILTLQSALETLDPLKKQQALEQLFGKFQFARMNALFSNLGKQGSQTLKVLDLMKASSQDLANVSSRELSMMTESASGKYKRALASVQADLAQVGKQFLTISTYVLRIVDGIVKFFDKLPAPIKSALGFLGGLTAVAGPLIMLTGVLGNFVGYVIKGVFHLKSLIKGGQGFKLLTPEIIAAAEAGKGLQSTFYNDAEATNVLRAAVDTLTESFNNLESKANAAKVAMNPAITTVANSVIMQGKEGQRVVDKTNPLIGKPYSRQMAHMTPAGTSQMGSIFGVVPNPGPVNVRIGKNPQSYMTGDMPKIPGVTSVNGISTGIVAEEAAKWHAMTGALAMQSESELKVLKTEVNATGTITAELSQSYQALLPEFTTITKLAASEVEKIVAEVKTNKINVDQARAKIVALNAEVEAMLAQTATQVAASMGRSIDINTVPLTGQPAVTATGKSNMKELFHKGPTSSLVDRIAAALGGVRTSGAGYSIQTTKPTKLNSGGQVYNPGRDGNVVPGSTSIKYDNTPAILHEGGFILNQAASQNNPDLVQVAKNGKNSGGKVVPALLTPGETYFPPNIAQNMMPTLEAANSGSKISLRSAGGVLGGMVMRGRKNYGQRVQNANQLVEYTGFHVDETWNDYARSGMVVNDAAALVKAGVPLEAAIAEADSWFQRRWDKTLLSNNGVFSQSVFDKITQQDEEEGFKALNKAMKKKYKIGKELFRRVPNHGSSQSLKRSDWSYGATMDEDYKTSRANILQSMSKNKNFNSSVIKRIIKETLLPGSGPNQGVHRSHTSPGANAKFSGLAFLGQATLQPHHINSLAMELSRYGIYPNAFSLDVNENKANLNDVAKKLGYSSHEDMTHKLTTRATSPAHPPAMRTNRGMTTILAKMLELKPADFVKWMEMRNRPGSFAAARLNMGGAVGGRVRAGKNNYGFTSNMKMFTGKYKSPLKWTEEYIQSRNAMIERAANDPRVTRDAQGRFWYNEAQYPSERGKFPQPKSYYQDMSNDDPAHGALQIGKYHPPMSVRNQHIGARVTYTPKLGRNWMERAASPAFELGTLETRAKSALFNYMQGDYSAINDPAVQQYLSTLRTKFTGTLHRGVRHIGSLPPVVKNLIAEGKWNELVGKEFVMRRSSWSTNKDTAEGFGQLQLIANVKNRNAVPASQIFPDLTFQSPQGPVHVNENEVYMGGRFRIVKASKNKIHLQAVYDSARENGGPVNAGRPYLVGEKGPELFIPKNAGGILPHYALGGRVHSGKNNYGIASTGGALLVGLLSQMLGSKIGGVPGTALSTAGNILPWMFMGAGKRAPRGPINSSPWIPPQERGPGWVPPGTKTPGFIGTKMPWATKQVGLAAKATTALEGGAAGGGKFASMLGRIALMGTRANLVIGGVTLAVMAGIKVWKQHQEFVRINAVGYGMTAAAAAKAGLKFKDYNSVIKDTMQNAKDVAARNKLVYESMADSNTPLNLTIEQYKKLKAEVKSVYKDQVSAINQAKDKTAAIALAKRLKEQLIAGGLSADEATKKIYTMFQMSNKAGMSIAATTGNRGFNGIKDAKTSAISAIQDYGTATKTQREGSAQAAQFNTAMQSIEAGIQQRIAESEKAARKDLSGKTKALTYLQAEKQQLDEINKSKDTGAKITQSTINELAKTDPEIKNLVNTSDTLSSVWEKIRLKAAGFSNDLSQLNAKQVSELSKVKDVIESTVIESNKSGMLKSQYANLDLLTKQQTALKNAVKGLTVQQQINTRDQLAGLQKQIDKNNKLADARLKALDAAKAESDLANQIAKKKAEYQAALATGNTAQAQQAGIDLQGLQQQQQYDAQKLAITNANAAANGPLQAKIDAINAGQQKMSDQAALAGEKLGKVTTALETQRTKINAVNDAMISLELNAKTAGVSVEKYAQSDPGKGLAAVLLSAMKAAGVDNPTTGANGKKLTVAQQAAGAVSKFGADASITTALEKLGGGQTLKDVVNAVKGIHEQGVKGIYGAKDLKKDNNGYMSLDQQARNRIMNDKDLRTKYNLDKKGSTFVYDGVTYVATGGLNSRLVVKDYGINAPEGKAGGGLIKGPGSGISDSIYMPKMPAGKFAAGAYVSNGEFIVKAKAVKQPGMLPLLNKINNMKYSIPESGLYAGGPAHNSGAVINLTQNIYPSDGMNTDAFVRQVVQQTKAAIGQDMKMNAKMVGPVMNVSSK